MESTSTSGCWPVLSWFMVLVVAAVLTALVVSLVGGVVLAVKSEDGWMDRGDRVGCPYANQSIVQRAAYYNLRPATQ